MTPGIVWRLAGASVGLILIAVLVARAGDHWAGVTALPPPTATPELIERGAYLAALGDCAACHSVRGQPPFSGGLRMETPIGAIYSTNITPDPKYGIGRFTFADFDRALRYGVANGHSLYPAMPYTSYYNTAPGDVAALYAYFRYAVAPAAAANRRGDIPFPLSMRWPLTYWRWLFASKPEPFQAPTGTSAEEARGAYLVEGLGHCGECHTSRDLFFALRARKPADGSRYLAGARIENYFAPSLRNNGPGSLTDWSQADLVAFLRTGANARGISFGSMSQVILHSTQYLTDADARAVARHLKSLDSTAQPRKAFVYDPTSHQRLEHGDASAPGAMVYLNNCAACHRPDGTGYERVFPPLAGNPVVQAPDPASVISIILSGSVTPNTPTTPAQFAMPPFAWRLSDREVAEVASFVRTSWGNHAAPTEIDTVQRLRIGGH
jgi:alcohol dehydrogenase (quinone), cytochrome c subunit